MKKVLSLTVAGILLIFTTACNNSEATSTEDILNKSMQAMEELTSYSMVTESHQVLGMTGEDNIDISTHAEVDLLLDPLTFYQHTSMDLGMLGGEMVYDTYFSEEYGLFMEDPGSGDWAKFPDTLIDEFLNLTEAQLSPEEQLKPLQDYISHLTLTTLDNHYVINLTGEGKEMEELVDQLSGMTADGMEEMLTQMMTEMDIKSLEYEIFIDKETFYYTEANIFIEMNLEVMEETIQVQQTSTMTFNNFNELDDLVIPEDILKNASELTEEDVLG